MTRVPRTARIRDVNGVMFVDRIREMVSFEHDEETENDVFRLVTSVEASCMNFVMGTIIIESLWLSGRASDRGK